MWKNTIQKTRGYKKKKKKSKMTILQKMKLFIQSWLFGKTDL